MQRESFKVGEDDQLDVGSIAVAYGLITPEALKDCREDVRLMRERGVKLSLAEVLLSKELLDQEALARVRKLRQALSGERTKLGHFELLEKLGEGGMGTVYKVRDVRSGQIAALKILPASLAGNHEFVQRFKGEARVLMSLSHPNIVEALDFGQLDYGNRRLHYIAMEYVDGDSLMERTERDGAVHERRGIEWLTDIARALQHAHHNGLVHRDVKPANIFITKDGHAKLGDFGLAVDVAEEATRITRTGIFMGSVHYASPEQAESLKDVDVRSDIYSLGATFYHALTGQVPFEGGSAPEILVMHLTEELPWPGDVNPKVSDPVSELIAKMMAKKKEDRFQDPIELLGALEELNAQRRARPFLRSSAESSVARSADGRRRVLQAHRRRRERAREPAPGAGAGGPAAGLSPRALAGAAAAAVLIGTAVGLLFLGGGAEKPPTGREAIAPRLPELRGAPIPEEEAELAPPPEAEPRARGLSRQPPRAAEEPAAGDSALLAGFERDIYAMSCGPAADAELTAGRAARGRGALRLVKLEGLATGRDASVEVDFPKPVDLSDYNRLGFWLRSSGPENEFRFALITAGREAFISPAKDPVFGAEWTWAEFVLAGHRESAEGFVIYFNRRGLAGGFDVYLDELRAYDRTKPVLLAEKAAAPAIRVPAPAGKVPSAPRPVGRTICEYDFYGGKPSEWDLGELTAPGRGAAGGCLKSVVHGEGNKRLRLRFEPRLMVANGTVAFFACRLENCTSFWIQCYDESRKKNVTKELGDVTPGVWGTVLVWFTDLVLSEGEGEGRCEVGDEIHSFSIFAGGADPGRNVYIDDFLIAEKEPPLVVADFEEGLGGAVSKYRHAIIDSTEAARVGKRGLAITVKPGDGRHQASRVELPVPRSDLSGFTHLSMWLGGDGFKERKGILSARTRAGAYLEFAHFKYGPDWKRHVFELKNAAVTDVDVFCFYFSASKDWPQSFRAYVDQLALHVGPPGPEEPVPARAAAEEARPPARLALAGEPDVLLAHDFEDGAGPFSGGGLTTANTFRSSRASYRATPNLKKDFFSCRIMVDKWSLGKKSEKGMFEVRSDTTVAFACYVDGITALTLMSWVEAKKGNYRYDLRNLPQKAWTVVQVRFLDFRLNDATSKLKVAAGDWLQNLSWLAGTPGKPCTFTIDDVVICNGRMPGEFGKSLALLVDKRRDTSADPQKDGFHITTEMVDRLARRFGDGKAAKRTVALLGDRLAGSNYFLAPLFRPGGALEGRRLIPKAALVKRTSRLSGYRRRDALVKALKKYRPEVVAVLVGYNDLKAGLSADEAATEYNYICECCIEAGAVPVLFTIPVRADSPSDRLARAYNEAVFKSAGHFGVPVVDAYSWLNAKGRDARRHFGPTGLRKAGHEELNSLFAELYRRLEGHVFKREE